MEPKWNKIKAMIIDNGMELSYNLPKLSEYGHKMSHRINCSIWCACCCLRLIIDIVI